MILSVSRRTDIPAFYTDWFFNRLRDGYALMRNPMNAKQIRRVALTPDVVDCIVFWSKNPKPLLARLDELSQYAYYIQYTLNPYKKDIEPGLPERTERIETFRAIAETIGAHRIIWRYDPILYSTAYTRAYHIASFGEIAAQLRGCTEKVTISFLDYYAKNTRTLHRLGIRTPDAAEQIEIARAFSSIAAENRLLVDTCAEETDFSAFGIARACCVDGNLIERITGIEQKPEKAKPMRTHCGCAPSVDIGAYHSCVHGCVYCYANYSRQTAGRNKRLHDPNAAFLLGGQDDPTTIG